MGIWEQLGLDMARHRMVALVGAGGKTSTLYALARQAADSGRTVVVTTTTHILRHPGLPLVEEPTPERLRAALEGHGVVTVGTVFRGDKLSGAGTPEELRRAADVVLVEADGAKRLPSRPGGVRARDPPCADAVAAVAGMDAVGQAVGGLPPAERVCALLGAGAEHVLTPEDVALLLANPQGGRKGVGEAMAFRCVLNKADTPERAAHASAVAGRLAERGIHSAITYYREEERGGLCWF
ncbi:MAG: selenium cofactor biosynthesis protein YqeC [Flavonifractor plautii]